MKILHTLATLNPASGGPARSVPQLALAQALGGHEVGVWSAEGGGAGVLLADLDALETGKIRVLAGSFEEALVAFGHPDLVHDHGIWLRCHRQVARVCKLRGIPRVVSPRGMLEPWALNHKKWKKRLAWWLYQQGDLQSAAGLHATAESEAAQLRKLGLNPPLFVAANGVDISKARIETNSDGSGKDGCSDEVGSKVDRAHSVLFLSRIHPKKGLRMWVDAWVSLRPPGWQMNVVGPDEDGHLQEVKQWVADAGLADCWHFAAPLEGHAKWLAMAQADLFVLPSHSENFGIVVAEALAARTPVITTTGTPWHGLEAHDCGWWVEASAEGLVNGFRNALARVDEFPQMGQRGRDWVEQEFAWAGIADRMIENYQRYRGDQTDTHVNRQKFQ